MTWGVIVVIVSVVPFCFNIINNGTILDFVDIQSSIQTDLVFFEQIISRKNNNYKFEDFFWTGSGDGPFDKDEEPWVIESPTTIFYTTTATVTTTIYTSGSTDEGKKNCNENCDFTTTERNILPTPSFDNPITTTQSDSDNFIDTDDTIDADREFWIITVFQSDGNDPELINLKNSLVKLYKKAFQRQQERHLGIGYKRRKRKTVIDKPVNVYIHDIDKKDLNGNKEVKILYHVAVSGKPISATTAVADMSLVTDEEAREEIGFPILIKAKPYISKLGEQQSLSKAKDTWIFIGVSIISLLVLLLLVAFATLGCTKRKKSLAGIENRRQIFERDVEEVDKIIPKNERIRKRIDPSPTYINFRKQQSIESIQSELSAKSVAYLSPSTSSSTSLDISPLMKIKKTPPKKPPRPKAALNKTVPINLVKIPQDLYDSESNDGSRRNSNDIMFIENLDPGVVSPKSYLSMPSVKSFPKINNPEPLNKVLEPVSMLHLDMPEDTEIVIRHEPSLIRHGSVGTNADPGVIGPVVWDIHCRKLQHGVSVDEGIDDFTKTTRSARRMRKRFHDLLDDTFSLFGSRMDSPVEETKPTPIEIKSKSAGVVQRISTPRPRPRTSISRNDSSNQPKGAWTSTSHSPLVRPLSAGITVPRINVEHIKVEGKFRDSDPAIPLIAAIKNELQKCSLPGSTADVSK